MYILYDLLFFIACLFYLPVYLFKGKFHTGFRQRLGFPPHGLHIDEPVWIHCVSVGEAIMMKPLIGELRKKFPQKNLVISTVTLTGNKIARSIAGPGDLVTYLPLDVGFIVHAVIKRINPSLFIIAETELWPRLITCLYRNNIPCLVVNSRISDKSLKGYLSIKLFLKPVLKRVSFFCAQSKRDKARLIALGAPPERVEATGNMKFDLKDVSLAQKDYSQFRVGLRLLSQEKLVVAASTHPGEEEMVLSLYEKLLKDYPGLRLLIAPRHPERSPEIERCIEKAGFAPLRVSKLDLLGAGNDLKPVFILDSVGQLLNYYAICDIVLVGGSLVPHGGHNILEPAIFGKPILFGPHMFNFRDIADLFLQQDAGLSVHNTEEAGAKIKELLNNPAEAKRLGARAQALIKENQGATLRNMRHIESLLAVR